MQALLDAVTDLVGLISPARVRTISAALRAVGGPGAAPPARTLADTPAARVAIERVISAWSETKVGGNEVAGLLLGASETRARVERELTIELVWTGPTTRFVAMRRTEQVLLDLIDRATSELFIVSFVVHEARTVLAALHDATQRGVRTRILVEGAASDGGSLGFDPAVRIRSSVPAAEIYAWIAKSAPFAGGKVHAKVALADERHAFITSANITGYAMERNMEAGILIGGGAVPKTLGSHFQALIDVGTVART